MTRQLVECAGLIEAGDWGDEAVLTSAAQNVLTTAADYLASLESQPFPNAVVEVSLVFTDDGPMTELNGHWRGKHQPTNVLSFPAYPIVPGDKPGPVLGDIVLSRSLIERESRDLGKPVEDHITHLLVHGFLHLFGYDHINPDEARDMENLETRILAKLGLSDPYNGMEPD